MKSGHLVTNGIVALTQTREWNQKFALQEDEISMLKCESERIHELKVKAKAHPQLRKQVQNLTSRVAWLVPANERLKEQNQLLQVSLFVWLTWFTKPLIF